MPTFTMPALANETRWNGHHDEAIYYKSYRPAIELYLQQETKQNLKCPIPLSNAECNMLDFIIVLLNRFSSSTTNLQYDDIPANAATAYMWIWSGIASAFGMPNLLHWAKISDSELGENDELVFDKTLEDCVTAASKVWGKYYRDISPGVWVAHVLDPRFKLDLLEATLYSDKHGEDVVQAQLDKIKSTVEQVLEAWVPVDMPPAAEPAPQSSNLSLGPAHTGLSTDDNGGGTCFDPFEKRVPKAKKKAAPTPSRLPILVEFQRYLEFDHDESIAAISKAKEDKSNGRSRAPTFPVAAEWRVKVGQVTYPRLFRVYLDFANFATTSVDSERTFSDAKLVVTDTRNRLKAETVQALVIERSILGNAVGVDDVLASVRDVFIAPSVVLVDSDEE